MGGAVKTKSKPGSGVRFAHMTAALMRKGHSEKSARSIAATVGRKKYGAKKMAQWAAAGRKRKS